MNSRLCAFLCLVFASSPVTAVFGESWSLKSGAVREGEALAFDFEQKVLTLSDPVTGKTTSVPTGELSLRSRQRLLVSPLFYKANRGDAPAPDSQDQLPLYALAFFAGLVIPAFWLSAWFVNGKVNPFLAVFASVGAWVILAIFFACYSMLRVRLEGGAGFILFGTVITLVATPIFVSAVYSCTYLRGLLLFGTHLPVAMALLIIGIVLSELISGKEAVDAWWNTVVFEPVGLTSISPAPSYPLPENNVPSPT